MEIMDVVNDEANFEDDFQFLKEMKDILIEEVFRLSKEFPDRSACDSEVKNGIFSETDDKRDVRIILPGGLQNVLDHLELFPDDITATKITGSRDDCEELCFVGFLGHKKDRSEMEESVIHDIDKTDAVVVQELSTIDGMIAYVTGERLKRGDYGNLVVFKDKGVVKNLKKSQNHAYAVK
ncbi:hypothetical protein C0Q70_18075 [Pomacea canaliculata]|uniref:Uncharacterized protein n=1 Tax=Pomacea canaliculata TaxID=400727 RepID=A0A2T7NM57_POMCA|nr:hypothetical protein C0Q70_18075 [Pomacea canaliculata]